MPCALAVVLRHSRVPQVAKVSISGMHLCFHFLCHSLNAAIGEHTMTYVLGNLTLQGFS
jgi:hypothetical protein